MSFKKEEKKSVLFSPLDWGLGHTTRSIPILKCLNKLEYTLYIACEKNSPSGKILQQEFPKAVFLPLTGYHIRYSKSKQSFALLMILQIPGILKAIKKEHKAVNNWAKEYAFDLIISDNRYGFYHPAIPSIFITHQLRIAAPFTFLENIIQKINYRYIRKFKECWIPDFDGENNIAGKLSHPEVFPEIPTKYIGPLSRITSKTERRKYDFLFLLSGPEPQRTLLEQKLLQLQKRWGKTVTLFLVRGLPNTKEQLPSDEHFTIKNYCDADELAHLLAQSEYIVARSGYSTVMELLYLQKKSILIATPGQTEQEYLSLKLHDQHWAYSIDQSDKNIFNKIKQAAKYEYHLPKLNYEDLEKIITETIHRLQIPE